MIHRRLRTFAVFAALALLAVSAPAQKAGAHRGIFLGFKNWGTPPASAVGQITPLNQWVAWPTRSSGPWAYWGDVISATQDVDNHRVIVPAYRGFVNFAPVHHAFLAWDPSARAVVSTLWSAKFGAVGDPQHLSNATLDSDGNLFSYDWTLDLYCKFDRMKGTWQSTAGPHKRGWGGMGGIEWDKLHGGYLFATGSNAEQALYHLSHDLTSRRLIASSFLNIQSHYGGGMLDDGEWVSSSARGGTYICVKPTTARWEHGPMTVWGVFTDCTPEKYAAPGRGYYAAFSGWWSLVNTGVAYVDAGTTPHTIAAIVGGPYPNNVLSAGVAEVLPLHERDLCTVRTGKATWDVRVNPAQPAFASKSFVLLASLTGAEPPIRLPDGREIFLKPDALTLATASGPIPPVLVGSKGVLDRTGQAAARLDLTALGTAANGKVIHFCALVFDPAAPSSIAWVCDPWAFVINVQP